jgi:thymidylate synthase
MDNNFGHRMQNYLLKNYDDTLKDILENGELIPNRTGVDCKVLFGVQCKYDISEYFPLPTKRKYYYKSVLAELLWMLSGSTNVNDLEKMNSKIWTAWRNKDFEYKNDYQDGEFGPIYGYQFRSFGGDYPNKNGFDQVKYVLEELSKNKFSRRALINLWDASVMSSNKVILPCCHFATNFMINSNDELICILHQRSGDWMPGIPANIIFYSAMTYIFASILNLKPKQLIHNVDNAHIYINQIDSINTYLNREVKYNCPKLSLNKKNLEDYNIDDFVFDNYQFDDFIKVPVMV